MRTTLLLAFVCCSLSGVAHARESNLDKARKHYQAGDAYLNAGRYDRAIEEFEAAYALVLRPPLLYNLGVAHQRKAEATGAIDDKRRSIDYFQKYLDADPHGKGTAEARAAIAALSRGLPPTTTVPAEPASPEPTPPPPVLSPPEPMASAPSPPVVPVPLPAPASDDGGGPFRIAGIVTAAAGVGLLVGGVVFAAQGKSAADQLNGIAAGGRWDEDLYQSGRSARTKSYVFLGLGATALVGSAVLYFVLGAPRNAETTVTVLPSGGLSISARF